MHLIGQPSEDWNGLNFRYVRVRTGHEPDPLPGLPPLQREQAPQVESFKLRVFVRYIQNEGVSLILSQEPPYRSGLPSPRLAPSEPVPKGEGEEQLKRGVEYALVGDAEGRTPTNAERKSIRRSPITRRFVLYQRLHIDTPDSAAANPRIVQLLRM